MTAAFVQRGHLDTDAGSGQRSGARRTSQGTRSRQRTSSQKPGEKPTATTLISNLRPPDWDGAFPPLKAPRLRSLVRAAPGHPRPKGRLFAAGAGAPQLVFLWPCGHGHPAAQAMGERRAGLQPPAAAGGRAAGLSPGPGHQPPRPGPSRPSARARPASPPAVPRLGALSSFSGKHPSPATGSSRPHGDGAPRLLPGSAACTC